MVLAQCGGSITEERREQRLMCGCEQAAATALASALTLDKINKALEDNGLQPGTLVEAPAVKEVEDPALDSSAGTAYPSLLLLAASALLAALLPDV